MYRHYFYIIAITLKFYYLPHYRYLSHLSSNLSRLKYMFIILIILSVDHNEIIINSLFVITKLLKFFQLIYPAWINEYLVILYIL